MTAVVLCGFTGTGKTSVGRRLAQQLGVPFVDTDAEIERREGSSIAEIFARRGEDYFRRIESELAAELSLLTEGVIATGGGMMLAAENVAALSSAGDFFVLEGDLDTIRARVAGDPKRPLTLATGPDADPIGALWEARRAAFAALPGRRINTSCRSIEETACDLREMITHSDLVYPLRIGARPLPGGTGAGGVCRIVAGGDACSRIGQWLDRLEMPKNTVLFVPRAHEGAFTRRVRGAIAASGHAVSVIAIDDGDPAKTLAQVSFLLDTLAERGAGRDTVLIAVGGGVTGDVTGLVASLYMRGVPFVQVPTTLLAQVDASIGGKVGVNHERAKNLIGAIYQPHLIVIDSGFLATLPARELASGMAEVIKTAMIGSPVLFERIRCAVAGHASIKEMAFLTDCVRECARVKASIVECDPFESDRRRVLNLGHTVGHALESALEYSAITHGEGVALGLLAALRVAVRRGDADERYLHAVHAMLEWCGLPTTAPALVTESVRSAMRLDKKRRDGRMTVVLPVTPGNVTIVNDVTEDELLFAVNDARSAN